MFITAELGQKVSKEEYKQLEPVLRQELLQAQFMLRDAPDFPVIIIFAGVDGAGKGATVNLLNEWMDPRWLVTNAYKKPSEEERERPPYWRYWRDLPPKGQIGMFLSSWYSGPLLDRVDLHVFVRPLPADELMGPVVAEASSSVRQRVMAARELQRERFRRSSARVNADMTPRQIAHYCPLVRYGVRT